MEIGIIGYGVVGGALGRWALGKGHTVKIIDKGKDINQPLDECRFIFLSVPVPQSEDKNQDLSALHEYVNSWPGKPLFIRSTVLPGTADHMAALRGSEVYAMPEFLTERRADLDFKTQSIVVGKLADKDRSDFYSLFQDKNILEVANSEAELAKYAHNCLGATKVNFMNIVKEVCERMALDYGRVLNGMLSTSYYTPYHTECPGPDGKYGYGGGCFPLNMSLFAKWLVNQDITGGYTLQHVIMDNERFRKKDVKS